MLSIECVCKNRPKDLEGQVGFIIPEKDQKRDWNKTNLSFIVMLAESAGDTFFGLEDFYIRM